MSGAAREQWKPCNQCGTPLRAETWSRNRYVCHVCGFHRRVPFRKRLDWVIDSGSFKEVDAGLRSLNPLRWSDGGVTYRQMLATARERSGADESFIYGAAKIDRFELWLGGFEFGFLGGTLGSVAGEKVARMLERAIEDRRPVIIFTASGGARMQEGMISLMQMSRIATVVARLNHEGVPLITVICDPTTGGVAASLAFMGDVVLAEPGALAGFAGPRVILQTIGEEMPPDVQLTDRLCNDGFIDEIVPRERLRERLIARLETL
ncbi:MAG: acetyl-CoA carboxylase carboxyl transferase subunit beta [Candidatus Dadabacteria bacterium]|nr:MAG: acetyl-CoA carboxylase carboxyl transferase subunit beta [Candidatus Dadabacteria bacterium]